MKINLKKKLKNFIINFCMVLTSLVFMVILTEIGFRVFVPQFFKIAESVKWHPEIGFKGKPYWKGTHIAVNREFVDQTN